MRNTFACVLVCITVSAHADIYRCDDSDGQAHFTDNASECETAVPVVLPPASKARAPEPDERLGRPPNLSSNFLLRTELGGDWEVVKQAPEPIDPAMSRDGLTASETRHYTRSIGAASEVCSVELWQFRRADAAREVAGGLGMPNWQLLRSDALLILTHGVRLDLGAAPDVRLLDDCAELGRRTHARAARTH